MPLVACLKFPPDWAHFLSTIMASPEARSSRKGASGFFRVIFTVKGSTTATLWTTENSRDRVAAVFGSRMRSMLNFTSSAVRGLPLWNFTLRRICRM